MIYYPCKIIPTGFNWVDRNCDMIFGSTSEQTRIFMYGFEDIDKGDSVRFELPKLKLTSTATETSATVRILIYEETPG